MQKKVEKPFLHLIYYISVKGVGPKCVKRIVSVFGLDTIAVIEDSPDKLVTVPGIGKKRVGMIRESWERQIAATGRQKRIGGRHGKTHGRI